jgi:hypothetical protein
VACHAYRQFERFPAQPATSLRQYTANPNYLRIVGRVPRREIPDDSSLWALSDQGKRLFDLATKSTDPNPCSCSAPAAAPFDPTVVGYQIMWGRQHHDSNTVRPHHPVHRGGRDLLRSRLVARKDSRTRPVAGTRRCTRSTGAAGSTGSRAGGARASPTHSSAVVDSFRLGLLFGIQR